jgi:competence protein ComEC
MTNKNNTIVIAILIVLALDVFVWYQIFSPRFFAGGIGGGGGAPAGVARDYFLDVGQGDSELIIFPGDVKVMTDAGPDDAVLASLARAMPQDDTYLDVAIISHPQSDHFNGFNFILDHYRVGAFIYNGRDDDPPNAAWAGLKAKIRTKRIPLITLGAGDKILIGAGTNDQIASTTDEIDFLSPNLDFAQSAELNDTGFVELIKTPDLRTLLSADTGFNVEDWLLAESRATSGDLRADVLKVGHHGSQYSSGADFLRAVAPRVAVIEVGAKNTYGHPGKDTLARLASSTRAAVFRTDRNGTVEVWAQGGNIKIEKEK